MPTQLSLEDLLTEKTDFHHRYPDVSGMTVPFEWDSVERLMSLPSPDFDNTVPLDIDWDYKRMDVGYRSLLRDIRENGFLDPIFLLSPHTMVNFDNPTDEIGNGHHRLIAAYDLGYTHVPITRDPKNRWRTSGRLAW